MLTANSQGNYAFLPGGEPYSSGVVAAPGFEIVHATLRRPVPYRAGFERIADHLRQSGRPRSALCAVELRSPAPFSREGFLRFNRDYCALLEEWGLLVDGQNPVARTNVAPRHCPPSEPSLYGFSYTVPREVAGDPAPPTFVVAGAGELRGGSIEGAGVVRPGETTADAMPEKAAFVMTAMARRLEGLGAGWEDVTAVQVYTVQPVNGLVESEILERAGPAALHGVRLHLARPPIDELEFEMDVRGVRTEIFL